MTNNNSEINFRIYTTQDVADIMKVDEMTIRRYIKAGKLERIENIGAIRITHDALIKFINSGKENE